MSSGFNYFTAIRIYKLTPNLIEHLFIHIFLSIDKFFNVTNMSLQLLGNN